MRSHAINHEVNEGGALIDTENVLGGGVRQIYDYNSAGRVKKFYDSTGTIFADGITYHPHGAMKQTVMGNLAGMIRQDWYNDRLQPCRLHVRLATEAAPTDCIDLINKGSVMEFSYDFDSDAAAGVQNNGNVGEMFDEIEGISYAYSYDELNRLKTADADDGAPLWGYDYDYDAWGNFHDRGVTAGSALILDVTPNLKNQLVDPGYDYDLAGNMIEKPDPVMNYNQEYDAENRLVKVTQGATVLGEYKYDGDGNRVMKQVGTTKTIYFRSAVEGNVRKEFVNSGSGYVTDRVYAYLNGSHLASYSPPLGGGWKYTFRDHLGTLRVRAGGGGAVISRHDFYPFGGEHTPPSADEDHVFTDQERDAETGLDYFIARHYGNNIGRFLQADAPFADQTVSDPMSWNMYSYVRNNPLAYTDPTGRACTFLNNKSGFCRRGRQYGSFDRRLSNRTRFFAAASATTQALANVAVRGLGGLAVSPGTRGFLESTGQALGKLNGTTAAQINSGEITGSGPALDAQLVNMEQTAVQGQLDAFKDSDPAGFETAIGEINTLLNSEGGFVLNGMDGLSQTFNASDELFAVVLDITRGIIGGDIDFANQEHREILGNALVQHIRDTGGCEVTANEASGC